MTSTLREGGGKAKMRCYGRGGWGINECFGRPIFTFLLLNKIGFGP